MDFHWDDVKSLHYLISDVVIFFDPMLQKKDLHLWQGQKQYRVKK